MSGRTALQLAQHTLLDAHGLGASDLQQVFGKMLAHRVDYADLYFQYSRAESWSLEEGIVKSGSFHIDQGVGVRAVSGDKTAFAYSDDITLNALEEAALATRAIARRGGTQTAAHLHPARARRLYLPQDPIATLDAAQKVELLEKLEKMARALDPRVTQVMANLSGEYEVVLVARGDGLLNGDIRPLVRLSLQVIVESEGRREQGSAGGGGRFAYDYFNDEVLHRYAQEAVHQATVALEARPAPAGNMTVVLGSGWPGILLHEAVGHGLEGDFNRKGSSAFSGRVGQRVAAKGVTVVDDGTIKDRRGSLNMDDEGNPTQRTVLIEDGILKGYMQDRLNARLMGVAPTGNGRRESYEAQTMPRMTNTVMLGGNKDPDEIVASIKRGLWAVDFGGGQVDITSGNFVFQCTEAYLVENGKVVAPVKNATLIGHGPTVLQQVSMIGNDFAMDDGVGVCGKAGQSVPVGVGQPTLKVGALTVGGAG